MIKFRHRGSFKKSEALIDRILKHDYQSTLIRYAEEGVQALSSATPIDTGKTASSWDYEIIDGAESIRIIWKNTNVNNGVNIALIIQRGHGMRNGGYVEGIDYINPALKPIFDKMSTDVWKEVTT